MTGSKLEEEGERKKERKLCPKNFLFGLESEKCGCQWRKAVNGMGREGEADQTERAGHFLR